jgi:hypothetical protein
MPFVKQLDADNWVKGVARPVAYIGATPRELCLSHGIQFSYHEGTWGLGDVEDALLETHSGRLFGLIRYPEAPRTDYTAILVDEKLEDATEHVDEIMCDLELQSFEMISFDTKYYHFRSCVLMREDDYGNRVAVEEFKCYPDAFYQMRKLECRQHKQNYTIEMREETPLNWSPIQRI